MPFGNFFQYFRLLLIYIFQILLYMIFFKVVSLHFFSFLWIFLLHLRRSQKKGNSLITFVKNVSEEFIRQFVKKHICSQGTVSHKILQDFFLKLLLNVSLFLPSYFRFFSHLLLQSISFSKISYLARNSIGSNKLLDQIQFQEVNQTSKRVAYT